MRLTAKQIVLRIQELMDGTEWDSDTTSQIAELLEDNGYPLRDPNEMEVEG